MSSISTESQIRQRLGIPADAKRVLLFSESSHWDPNWLYTSEEYFARFVHSNLDQALAALRGEPRRIYSVECMFFLRKYWERCPEQRDSIRELVNAGRLRLTGSGVTTADTLLPSAEAILRDLLVGQEWLRANGMQQEPDLAYFTDSFGCTPALPSLLRAAGFDRTAITRIDGMYFLGCDLESAKNFPRPGSSAERLLKQERSLDFVWRDPNGAQVLSHWNAFSYGQGDMLAYEGLSRVYIVRVAFPRRSDGHIARRIAQYTAQLAPLSRTPYMFCPIGFDFVEPIPDLVALLDRYNQNHYPASGVWAVNAGLDDYLALIEPYQDQLPVVELDPNPYWTGFYSARPRLKQRCRELVDDLLQAEKLSVLLATNGIDRPAAGELDDAWWRAAVSNHHDFITGTSPDRVVAEEQIPWLDQASAAVKQVSARLVSSLPDPAPAAAETRPAPPIWSRENGRVRVTTPFYNIELAEDLGGAITRMHSADGLTSLLGGLSNDLVSYLDLGGLWRMGMEFVGGAWKELQRASRQTVPIQVEEGKDGLEITSSVVLDGQTLRRWMWLRSDTPLIRCRVVGQATQGHSITVRFETGLAAEKLVMDTPGGLVGRPSRRFYDPTFWPLHQFAHLQDSANGRGLAILQRLPGAISFQPGGGLELVAMRNATHETAFGLIGLPANPASGHEYEDYAFEYGLLFTSGGDWRVNDVYRAARDFARPAGEAALRDLAGSLVTTGSADVYVTAVKPASRGAGIILRLYSPCVPDGPLWVRAPQFKIAGAALCDARERDLEPLAVQDGAVQVTMTGTIATMRLLIA